MPLPVPTLGLRHLALRVRDLPTSRAFYRDVFGFQPVWEPDPHNSYLSSGSDNLALHQVDAITTGTTALDHLGLLVPNRASVWAAAALVKAHQVPIVAEPRDHRDGSSSFYCSDPDGNTVQVIYEPQTSYLRWR